MAPQDLIESEADPHAPNPRDSMSSVSTISIVFDRLHEETEKQALRRQNRSREDHAYADLDDDDPLKTEASDMETGAFLPNNDGQPLKALTRRQPMDKGFRRVIIIAAALFAAGWIASLVVFVVKGTYQHDSDFEHDPDAGSRGSGKSVTLDQVMQGFWNPKSKSLSWIDGPDGEDGLLLEEGGDGKDYLVVEDVRASGEDTAAQDAHDSRTLMKSSTFNFNGDEYKPSWNSPSPDFTKVLLAVDKEKTWRHSWTASYFILDVKTQEVEPLVPLDVGARIQLATWSPTSDAISFTREDNNIYIRRLRLGSKGIGQIEQVTHDGGIDCFNGVPDWVYEEEVIQGRSVTWWSADGKHLAFFRTNETGVPEYPLQYFVSRPSGEDPAEGEESYPEEQRIKYPKAGAHNPVVGVRYYDLEKGDTFGVDVAKQFADDDRVINHLVWAGPGKVLVKQTNRVSDVLQVILVDLNDRKAQIIRSRDVAAEDGGWFEISHSMTFIPADPKNGRSDDGYVDAVIHEGFEHVAYFTPLTNSDPIMLTSGEWEVEDAPSAVELKGNLVYFVAAKEASIQRHVYSVSLLGDSEPKPLTETKGEAYYGVSFSKGAGYALLTYSGPKVPSQRVVSTPSNPDAKAYEIMIEDNAELADRARQHALPILKYGTLDLGDGVSVNYLERRPPHFNPSKSYPVLFQQYSGPGSQSVNKKFRVDFHSYIASSLGYIVITVDPRGTGFLGRKHRVAVRDRLGVLEAEDHIAAAKQFASESYIDASRLAMWGWSYGGFQTLKVLEQDAGQTFSYGMAVAPVTDWRFYDSIYAERYMRLPKDNEDGYDESSVRNATALGENVRFLLMHGTADDNVHFQNSLTLLDQLDLAGVFNYDVHVFPDSDHGISFHSANKIVYESMFQSHSPYSCPSSFPSHPIYILFS